MAPTEPPAQYAPGQLLAGRFRIVSFLGRGGMGEVYEASDLDLNQHVALKLVRSESRTNPRLLALLRDEVRKARSVSHPNVCRVYDLERDPESGVVFIAMELLRGETLCARLLRTGASAPDQALPILREIASGMDAIHARPMLHLDLKPANIILENRAGRSERAVVTDFGFARSLMPKESGESTDPLVECNGGTPPYMAPERFLALQPTSAADVYAFGLIAREMLVGSTWIGPPGVPPPALRSVDPNAPPEWDSMIGRCLAPAPEDRFASCGAAIASLEKKRGFRGSPRSLRVTIPVAMVALLAITAAFMFWPSGPRPSAVALRWYKDGIAGLREGTYYKAVRALEQSIKEAPTFPLAHASLAEAWIELDSPERAAEEMLRASPASSRYRIHARDAEHLQAIRSTVTRDFGKALQDYTHLAQTAVPAERAGALVDLGRALERASEPGKAMEQFEAAIRLDPNYAGAYLRLAIVAGQLQQSGKTALALQKAESLYDAASNLEGATEVFYQRGAYANQQARLKEAEELLDRARLSALAARNPHQQIRALHQLSAVAYQRGDTAAGQKFAEAAIREARASNIEFLAGRGFFDLGNALATRGDFDQAAGYFQESLRIARNYHSGKLEAMALYGLGSIGIRTRMDEGDARQVEQALEWFRANGYPREASLCLVTLGRFRRDRGDLTAAAEAFYKQLELAKVSHDDFQTALALSSVASVLVRQERFPEALQLTLEQLAISQRLGDGLRLGYAHQSLARLYLEMGRFAEAELSAGNADAAGTKGNIEELRAGVAVTRARILLQTGRMAEAAALADEKVRTFTAKYPRQAGELLEVLALARHNDPVARRLDWCERSRKLAQGSFGAGLSLRLTELQLLLQARSAQRVLDGCRQLTPIFERQQSDYSLFRAELIGALAKRQLQQSAREELARAAAALDRFRKRFDPQAWNRFRARPDFVIWEKYLTHLGTAGL